METSKHRIRGFTSYQRFLIRERAKGKCQFPDCDKAGEECHHIIGRSYAYKKLKWKLNQINDISNGVLLCHKHHAEIHQYNAWKSYIKYFLSITASYSIRL
ncbi:MAG: HNH endonuclease signature motif containing protein [Candidatus Heimdallarchaeaceae archaeon]